MVHNLSKIINQLILSLISAEKKDGFYPVTLQHIQFNIKRANN
jgi:hypothetical protein